MFTEIFKIFEGALYKLIGKTWHPVKAVENGSLRAYHKGVKYTGEAIAWTLHYGTLPAYKVMTIDGNPCNLAKHNLIALVPPLPERHIKRVSYQFQHNLADDLFDTAELARADWRNCLIADMGLLQKFALEQGSGQITPQPAYVDTGSSKPRPLAKRSWMRSEGVWYALADPVCVADDYFVRLAQAKLGKFHAYFDETRQQVFYT